MNAFILVTGASGEIGTSLIRYLAQQKNASRIVAVDINDLGTESARRCSHVIKGSITDASLLEQLTREFSFSKIFHLAGVLSTSGEKKPLLAHHVNVDGTLGVLELARTHTVRRGEPVMVVFPSTIAAYGIPSLALKEQAGRVQESMFLEPITMYGNNKLYCERLGTYYSETYQLLADYQEPRIDFRCVRLCGVISAETVPTGGTSDYAPEMLHKAAQGLSYDCFVRPDTTIPFMVMPDAVKALTQLSEARPEKLTQRIYNVASYSFSAAEFAKLVTNYFPGSSIRYQPSEARQKIVDSWPSHVNDDAARNDWDWKPEFDLTHSFNEYLAPVISEQYNVPRAANT